MGVGVGVGLAVGDGSGAGGGVTDGVEVAVGSTARAGATVTPTPDPAALEGSPSGLPPLHASMAEMATAAAMATTALLPPITGGSGRFRTPPLIRASPAQPGTAL